MRVAEICRILDAELITGDDFTDIEINSACGSDLMSDVMAYVKESVVLLTGLINLQVIRTAEMMDIKVIVFVRGKCPLDNMIELAEEKGIVLLKTKLTMFVSCGKLYEEGLKSSKAKE